MRLTTDRSILASAIEHFLISEIFNPHHNSESLARLTADRSMLAMFACAVEGVTRCLLDLSPNGKQSQ
ncbi:hypothetical protein B0H19DRAFT_1175130 [Mycena capillaripes]|nr:hypothetical protein B0H19DRAFT_1175130 [Mycena capillaripes]